MIASQHPSSSVDRISSAVAPFPAPAAGLNRTGGLVWHARALRASARWYPTRAAIAGWLDRAGFESRQLVLIGASAGWMMSTGFLARFESVDAVDIDSLAEPLFMLRHGLRLRTRGVRVRWHRVDALERIDELLDRWPSAALLFDNVLGQQIYRHRDLDSLEAALSGLSHRLAGREWGSIHDRLSGPASPPDSRAVFATPPRRAIVEAGGVRLDGGLLGIDAADQTLLAAIGGHGPWQDHRTAGVFPPGTDSALIPWEFRPGKWHWLQAGRVAAEGTGAGPGFADRGMNGHRPAGAQAN